MEYGSARKCSGAIGNGKISRLDMCGVSSPDLARRTGEYPEILPINPPALYFFFSQVHAVYRFDETLAKADPGSFEQPAANKLRFLPCSLVERFEPGASEVARYLADL